MSQKPTLCYVPSTVSADDSRVYKILVEAHCKRHDKEKHKCVGRITFTADSVTLQCSLCGDARAKYTE